MTAGVDMAHQGPADRNGCTQLTSGSSPTWLAIARGPSPQHHLRSNRSHRHPIGFDDRWAPEPRLRCGGMGSAVSGSMAIILRLDRRNQTALSPEPVGGRFTPGSTRTTVPDTSVSGRCASCGECPRVGVTPHQWRIVAWRSWSARGDPRRASRRASVAPMEPLALIPAGNPTQTCGCGRGRGLAPGNIRNDGQTHRPDDQRASRNRREDASVGKQARDRL